MTATAAAGATAAGRLSPLSVSPRSMDLFFIISHIMVAFAHHSHELSLTFYVGSFFPGWSYNRNDEMLFVYRHSSVLYRVS